MDFLLYLSTVEQIVIVTVVFSGLSVLGLYIVRILVPLETLKKNHEVAGFTFGVLGAFYGLLLAYYGVRCLIHEGALEEQIEPTSISFLHALNVVIRHLPQIVSFSPSGQAALP